MDMARTLDFITILTFRNLNNKENDVIASGYVPYNLDQIVEGRFSNNSVFRQYKVANIKDTIVSSHENIITCHRSVILQEIAKK